MVTTARWDVTAIIIRLPSGKRLHDERERSTILNGKTHHKSPFSVAMLNNQRVYHVLSCFVMSMVSQNEYRYSWPLGITSNCKS